MKYNKEKKRNYINRKCNENFICKNCNSLVSPEEAGTGHRNHCPYCLSSIHVDDIPGDRTILCKGIMDPITVWVRKNGEWALVPTELLRMITS